MTNQAAFARPLVVGWLFVVLDFLCGAHFLNVNIADDHLKLIVASKILKCRFIVQPDFKVRPLIDPKLTNKVCLYITFSTDIWDRYYTLIYNSTVGGALSSQPMVLHIDIDIKDNTERLESSPENRFSRCSLHFSSLRDRVQRSVWRPVFWPHGLANNNKLVQLPRLVISSFLLFPRAVGGNNWKHSRTAESGQDYSLSGAAD